MADHHSDEKPLGEMSEADRRRFDEALGIAGLGPTGRYPEGRMGPHDEGELMFRVGRLDDKVIIDFSTPVRSLGMGPDRAREFAALLIKHADACS